MLTFSEHNVSILQYFGTRSKSINIETIWRLQHSQNVRLHNGFISFFVSLKLCDLDTYFTLLRYLRIFPYPMINGYYIIVR